MEFNLEKLEIESQSLLTEVKIPKITDLDTYAKAGDVAKFLKNKITAWDNFRKEMTVPFARQVKAINAKFKKGIEPLETVVNEIVAKQKTFYIAEQARKDAEQESLEKKAIASGASEVAIVNDIKSIQGYSSSTTASKFKSYEVMDITMVPKEFLTVDDKLVKEHLSNNFNNPPAGIKYYYEIRISNR